MTDDEAMTLAAEEARRGMAAGNDPVGAVLVRDGIVVGAGHNCFMASGDPSSHAEMEAYRDAARRLAVTLPASEIEAVLCGVDVFTTAMPCEMCAGAILRWRARRVVVSETSTYRPAGTRALMERHGIVVEERDEAAMVAMVEDYLARHPERAAAYRCADRPAVVAAPPSC